MPLTTRRRAAYSHSRLPSVPWRVSVVLSPCRPARVAARSPRRHAPRDRCASIRHWPRSVATAFDLTTLSVQVFTQSLAEAPVEGEAEAAKA